MRRALTTSQDIAALLPRYLPPTVSHPLIHALTTMLSLAHTLSTHLTPLLREPSIPSLLALALLLLVTLKILDMAYRAVLFWIRLAFRLAFWGAVVGVGFWVWSRGVDGFVEDVGELAGFWWGEYERWKGEVEGWRGVEEEKVWGKVRQRVQEQQAWGQRQGARRAGRQW